MQVFVFVYNVASAKLNALVREWRRRPDTTGCILVLHLPSDREAPNTDEQVVRCVPTKDVLAACCAQSRRRSVVWCSNPSLLPAMQGSARPICVRHTRACIDETLAYGAIPRSFCFVSLGRSCHTAHNLNKHVQKSATQFFDWLRSCFESVLLIFSLSESEFDTLYHPENLAPDTEMYRCDGNVTITLKSLDRRGLVLLSHHDICLAGYQGNEIAKRQSEFIEKYRRRHTRLLTLVRDSVRSDSELVFLRIEDTPSAVCETQYLRFQQTIRTICPDARYRLVVLSLGWSMDMPPSLTDTHIHMRLGPAYLWPADAPAQDAEWTLPHYNWAKVYQDATALL